MIHMAVVVERGIMLLQYVSLYNCASKRIDSPLLYECCPRCTEPRLLSAIAKDCSDCYIHCDTLPLTTPTHYTMLQKIVKDVVL